ncbi:hypothetical protein N0V82_006358 [Gnomoniopsis sp. IMI 355080]|nr:hypothetical protein N0V82_006358 [Gnomoniopsis sp. IMI 355080]
MAAKGGERTASSATRFTATTPHASSKLGSGAAKAPTSRFAPGPRTEGPGKPVGSRGPSLGAETPEQRVARLRAAHEAAKNAKISRFDSILAKARPFFDSAHRLTVISLVGLTAVAGLMTAYTAYDMLRYNRARKIEFFEAQKKMSAESLEAARLAYMRGDATDEQMSLIEEANARPEGFQLPSILSAPKPIEKTASEEPAVMGSSAETQPEKKSGLWGFFSSGSKKEGQDAAAEKPQPRSLDDKRAMLESARAAFEQEKENQVKGGPLDRLGTDNSISTKTAEQPKKKGWLW